MLRTTLIAGVMLAGLGVSAAVAWGLGMFNKGPDEPIAKNDETTFKTVENAGKGGMDQAVELIKTARDKFASVKDYRATFLRDELIDGEFKENYLTLKVRHEPFSVYMKWLAPASKAGRQSIYVEGQNNGKMRVSEKIAGSFAVTVSLDPEESKKRKESRHTILEAGYKNLCDKYVKSWTKEKDLGLTQAVIEQGELRITLPGQNETKLHCHVVTTIHDPKDREQFQFYRSRLYFNKDNGMLVRVQVYDWPESADDKEGRLVERYTYLNIEPNLGLTDADFRL
jgi:hypothetical protein